MKQATPQHVDDRKPGRSFDDPKRPMGEDLLARSPQSSTAATEDFRSREAQADTGAHGVAERAKAIGVLRKAEELIGDNNPGAADEDCIRTCFELAAGRVGLTIGEYDALVKGDPELKKLETNVIEAARARFV